MSAERRFHLYFSGSVQGVGFRYTAQKSAQQFEVKGWVKNIQDGQVEMEVQGQEKNVAGFLHQLHDRMKRYIQNTMQREVPIVDTEKSFEIIFYEASQNTNPSHIDGV